MTKAVPDPGQAPRGEGAKVRRIFIDTLLGTLGLPATPEFERTCDLILFRLTKAGLVFVPLPDDLMARLAANEGSSVQPSEPPPTVEAPDADVQGKAVPQDR